MRAIAMCQNSEKIRPPRDGSPFDRVGEQARIKALLAHAGFTLAAVEQKHGLADGICRDALRQPNMRGERAIAAVLKTHPHLLWPSRYRPNGQRRKPLDWARVPTLAQRRNNDAQLAEQQS